MSLTEQLARFAARAIATPEGVVLYRRAATPGTQGAVTHVLLHGIGSASASWVAQLSRAADAAAPASHVLAWDAPGYGDSDALPMQAPAATDYARRMWGWLDALGAQAPFTLVGHSLGALMAAAAAVSQPRRVRRLVLLAPAQGYATADAAVRERKRTERLDNLERLGPAGMARARAGAMLSPRADSAQVAFVEQVMAAIRPHGYTQATHMLSGGSLAADLARVQCPVTIASGSADGVTPPEGCRGLARGIGADYVDLGAVGHSCALEAAEQVNRLLGLAGDTP